MSTEEEEIDPINNTEENVLDNDVNDDSSQGESDIDYFAQFSCPDDSDDDDSVYFDDNTNDDVLLTDILDRHQLTELNNREENHYQRSKRSHKKINALRQIKTKHAQSIKINSHNKHLYIHHRIFKRIHLDPPSQNYMPSTSQVPTYCSADLRTIREQQQQTKVSPPRPPAPTQPVIQFPQHTIQRSNIPNEACFDDAMVRFLLDMQNRDLGPEDYEMLLRLDERVQRKTVDKNILNTLPTIQVDQTHLNDQCTICMEEYTLGQSLKLLPCKHFFHIKCIETYLKEFSVQCPLDNLPLV